ncbi:MAG: hypothetical protein H7Z17_10320, partial [Fuerstia sp.]|nr:hypothetical protein [Fuerstiella sp.]
MTKHTRTHVTVLSLALCCVTSSAQAAKPEADEAERAKVQQVLQSETATEPNAVNRRGLLQPTQRPETKSDPTWWQSGYVKVDGEWRSVEKSTASSSEVGLWTEYRRQRDDAPKTADGQFALANWCRSHKLADQERAHLMQTLLLAEPNRDVKAIYDRMKFKQLGSRWIAPSELAEIERQSKAATEDLQRWLPRVQRIARNLDGNAKQQRIARDELAGIDDPSSIPALVANLGFRNEQAALATVDVLARLDSYQAAQALAYEAVFAPWRTVTDRAVELLASRRQDEYVPELMSVLQGPVKTVIQDRPGMPYARFTALQEGHDHVRLARFTFVHFVEDYVDYQRPMVPSESGVYRRTAWGWIRTTEDASSMQRRTAASVEQIQNKLHDLAEDATDAAEKINQRVGNVLSRVASEPESSDPQTWWSWWANQIGIEEDPTKPVVVVVDEKQSGRGLGRTRPVYNRSCLVAGTPIWTDRGMVAIEKLAAGDCVLAKNIETGELAYKPVIHTTSRHPISVTKFIVNGQPVVASSGHNFWVSGSGWTKTRELIPQQPIHTVVGMARVESVEDEAVPAPVYNLVVADFHTYFVG